MGHARCTRRRVDDIAEIQRWSRDLSAWSCRIRSFYPFSCDTLWYEWTQLESESACIPIVNATQPLEELKKHTIMFDCREIWSRHVRERCFGQILTHKNWTSMSMGCSRHFIFEESEHDVTRQSTETDWIWRGRSSWMTLGPTAREFHQVADQLSSSRWTLPATLTHIQKVVRGYDAKFIYDRVHWDMWMDDDDLLQIRK